jgi:hypothetical protein
VVCLITIAQVWAGKIRDREHLIKTNLQHSFACLLVSYLSKMVRVRVQSES